MNEKIQVRDERPGKSIATGLVGPWLELFEIRQESLHTYRYYVGDDQVSREAYLDAMQTVDHDRYCHDCMGEEDSVDHITTTADEPS